MGVDCSFLSLDWSLGGNRSLDKFGWLRLFYFIMALRLILFVLCILCIQHNIQAQDVIVKKDGSTIVCKTLEITSKEIKYKKFSNLDGPLFSIDLSEVQHVNFENGEKEEFNVVLKNTLTENKIILKAGTEVPIQIITPIKAADVKKGQSIPFKVSKDVRVNGEIIIPYGTMLKGIVYKANKSSWWGTKGKLGIKIDNIVLSNGIQIPLNNGNIYVTGVNRTALSVLLFCFVTIPACAICGSKAEIPVGYEILANVAEDVVFNADKSYAEKQTPLYVDDKSQSTILENNLRIIHNENAVIVDIYANTQNCVISSDNQKYVYFKKVNSKGKVSSLEEKILKKLIKEIRYQ